jgi:hypothetical protein
VKKRSNRSSQESTDTKANMASQNDESTVTAWKRKCRSRTDRFQEDPSGPIVTNDECVGLLALDIVDLLLQIRFCEDVIDDS